MIAKRLSAAVQSSTGLVHFFAMLRSAKYSSLTSASSFGNDPRVFVTLRNDMFNDSIALVVYMIFRISGGCAKNGITLVQLLRQDLDIIGNFPSHFRLNSASLCSAASAVAAV